MSIYGTYLHEIYNQNNNREIIKQNKATLKKISINVFNLAKKYLNKIKSKYKKFKYIADQKYIIYNDDEYYYKNPENDGYFFGLFVLFDIDLSKYYNSFRSQDEANDNINEWEHIIFELVDLINSDKEISKYGYASTEQPDDGGDIDFKIKDEYFIIDDDYEQKKNEIENKRIEAYTKAQAEEENKQKILNIINSKCDKLKAKKYLLNQYIKYFKNNFNKYNYKTEISFPYANSRYMADRLYGYITITITDSLDKKEIGTARTELKKADTKARNELSEYCYFDAPYFDISKDGKLFMQTSIMSIDQKYFIDTYPNLFK